MKHDREENAAVKGEDAVESHKSQEPREPQKSQKPRESQESLESQKPREPQDSQRSQESRESQKPQEPQEFRSGFVALAGRPNAGKSTLINAVVGRKLAITSNTPQTTRHRFRAILNRPQTQLILVDTPGLHKPMDALGKELNRSALKAFEDVDAVAFVLDATQGFGKGDAWVLEQLRNVRTKTILVITKSELATDEQVANQIAAAEAAYPFVETVVTSALEGKHVEDFIQVCLRLLPNGPAWFSQEADTDMPLEVLVAEFIREKILTSTFDELPHAVGVAVEGIDYDEKRNHYSIEAFIYVERESQKGMIVGKGGSKIKAIGTQARKDLEYLLGASVYLDVRVKLRKNWRRDAQQIRRFGYGE